MAPVFVGYVQEDQSVQLNHEHSVDKNSILKYALIVIVIVILGYIIFLIERVFFTEPNITLDSNHVISTKLQKYDASQMSAFI